MFEINSEFPESDPSGYTINGTVSKRCSNSRFANHAVDLLTEVESKEEIDAEKKCLLLGYKKDYKLQIFL